MKKMRKTKRYSWVIGLIIFILTILSIVHAVRSRTFEDFLKYSVIIMISSIAIYMAIMFIQKYKFEITSRRDALILLPVGIALLLIGPLYYSIGVSLKDLYLWLLSPEINKDWLIPITVLLTLTIGGILFLLRLKARIIYGVSEATIGIAIAVHKVSSEFYLNKTDTNFYLAFLTASIYLVVRGFDNIHQGFINRSKTNSILFPQTGNGNKYSS